MRHRFEDFVSLLWILALVLFCVTRGVGILFGIAALIGPDWFIAICICALAAWAWFSIDWLVLLALAGCVMLTIVIVPAPSAGRVLLCAVCWMASFFTAKEILSDSADARPFQFALARSGFDFASVFAAAALTALMLAWQLGRYPPAQVLAWRDGLFTLRTVFKAFSIGSGQALLVLAAIFALEHSRFQSRTVPWLTRLWRAWRAGSRWLKRGALSLTALFCFTFTAIQPGGVIEGMEREIVRADQLYAELIWQMDLDLRAQAKIQIYETAWRQLSEPAKQILRRETEWNVTAEGIPPEYLKGYVRYGLPTVSIADLNEAAKKRREMRAAAVPDREPQDLAVSVEAPHEATPGGISAALEAARAFHGELKTPEWMKGIGGEALDKLIDVSISADYAPFVTALKSEYPVLGEVLAIVNGALNAGVKVRIRNMARRLAHEMATGGNQDLPGRVRTLVAGLAIEAAASLPRSVSGAARRAWDVRQLRLEAASKRFEQDLAQSIRQASADLESNRAELNKLRKGNHSARETGGVKPQTGEVTLAHLEELQGTTKRYKEEIDRLRPSGPKPPEGTPSDGSTWSPAEPIHPERPEEFPHRIEPGYGDREPERSPRRETRGPRLHR